MLVSRMKTLTALCALTAAAGLGACVPTGQPGAGAAPSHTNQTASTGAGPTIEAAPLAAGQGAWKVATDDDVTFTVSAPDAQGAVLLYRPVVADETEAMPLKKLTPQNGKLSAQLKLPADFAGQVWAEVSYKDGSKKQTEPISLMSSDQASGRGAAEGAVGADAASPSSKKADPNQSARSDALTGGRIEHAELVK